MPQLADTHLPGARTIEVTSTSTAAQLAQDKPGAAAIASLQAGVHYGLDILAADIEDNKGNLTRFAVIGDDTGGRTGNDKCALMFEITHRPGALADAMNTFQAESLNLTWIESFPIRTARGGLHVLRRDGGARNRRASRAKPSRPCAQSGAVGSAGLLRKDGPCRVNSRLANCQPMSTPPRSSALRRSIVSFLLSQRTVVAERLFPP